MGEGGSGHWRDVGAADREEIVWANFSMVNTTGLAEEGNHTKKLRGAVGLGSFV